jgi:integrase
LSGVRRARPHRFRRTLATEILENGGTAEDAANILGNSPAMIRKHYSLWSIKRQERISSLLQTVHSGTFLAQKINRSVS